MRTIFYRELWRGLVVVWPILSAVLAVMVVLGLIIAWREGWSIGAGIYFAFVSGLTIGYGDLAPKHPMTRTLAIIIGAHGILLTGLVAAIAVQALEQATKSKK